jgi:hypothetical protein
MEWRLVFRVLIGTTAACTIMMIRECTVVIGIIAESITNQALPGWSGFCGGGLSVVASGLCLLLRCCQFLHHLDGLRSFLPFALAGSNRDDG